MGKTKEQSLEEANALVMEHHSWAESVARAVARAWNLDWRLDGLDGAAMEALIFCSRRYDASRGVPFRGYARKRIHEAATEQARKSKGWRKSPSASPSDEQRAREISAELLNIFPDLREGHLSVGDDYSGGAEGVPRAAIRELLVSASLLAARDGAEAVSPEETLDYKRMVVFITDLEPVHQLLLWKVYWEGVSMRTVASEWDTDELNVIREHKALMGFLQKCFQKGKAALIPKVRPGLKNTALRLKKSGENGPFTRLARNEEVFR